MNAGRLKVEMENRCRHCGIGPAERVDAAHLWPRSLGGGGFDDPDNIIPLCSAIKGSPSDCHGRFDAHRLDVLALLTTDEQVALVRYAGSIERARTRVIGEGDRALPRHPDSGPF